MGASSKLSTSEPSEPAFMKLTEADILGAVLDEPLNKHNVAILRWWLLCHRIKLLHSWKKQQLISRFGPSV